MVSVISLGEMCLT